VSPFIIHGIEQTKGVGWKLSPHFHGETTTK
jgi:hypothetical protein